MATSISFVESIPPMLITHPTGLSALAPGGRCNQPGRDRSPRVTGDRGVRGVSGVLERLEALVLLGVLEDRPLRLAEQDAGDEVVLALAGLMAGLPGGLRASYPRHADLCEFPRDVIELLDPAADSLEIRRGKNPARRHRISDAALIPFQSDGLDDSVEQPALLGKAAHPSRRAGSESGHGRYLL
jgi:hypothetical protein